MGHDFRSGCSNTLLNSPETAKKKTVMSETATNSFKSLLNVRFLYQLSGISISVSRDFFFLAFNFSVL